MVLISMLGVDIIMVRVPWKTLGSRRSKHTIISWSGSLIGGVQFANLSRIPSARACKLAKLSPGPSLRVIS